MQELELTYLNAIDICISSCSNNCWLFVKKCRCQQKSRSVSCDLYIFKIFFRWGITCQVSSLWQMPPICEQPRKCTSWIEFNIWHSFTYLTHLFLYLILATSIKKTGVNWNRKIVSFIDLKNIRTSSERRGIFLSGNKMICSKHCSLVTLLKKMKFNIEWQKFYLALA